MVSAADIEIFLSICITGFALLLFVTAFLSFRRTGISRIALVSVAFAVFALKGILLFLGLVSESAAGLGLDFVIMLFLYFAIGKR